MKAITANNIGLEASNKTLLNRNIAAREVVHMNLISSIMIKDNDIKEASVDNKRTSMKHDYGFSLYKALEFSKGSSKNISHNLQLEMICSRLV